MRGVNVKVIGLILLSSTFASVQGSLRSANDQANNDKPSFFPLNKTRTRSGANLNETSSTAGIYLGGGIVTDLKCSSTICYVGTREDGSYNYDYKLFEIAEDGTISSMEKDLTAYNFFSNSCYGDNHVSSGNTFFCVRPGLYTSTGSVQGTILSYNNGEWTTSSLVVHETPDDTEELDHGVTILEGHLSENYLFVYMIPRATENGFGYYADGYYAGPQSHLVRVFKRDRFGHFSHDQDMDVSALVEEDESYSASLSFSFDGNELVIGFPMAGWGFSGTYDLAGKVYTFVLNKQGYFQRKQVIAPPFLGTKRPPKGRKRRDPRTPTHDIMFGSAVARRGNTLAILSTFPTSEKFCRITIFSRSKPTSPWKEVSNLNFGVRNTYFQSEPCDGELMIQNGADVIIYIPSARWTDEKVPRVFRNIGGTWIQVSFDAESNKVFADLTPEGRFFMLTTQNNRLNVDPDI